MANAGGIRMGKVFVEIGADSSKFFAEIGRLNRKIGQIGQSFSNVGMRMAGIGAAIAAPVVLATRQFSKFDDAIRATAAVTGSFGPKGAAAFSMLNDKARELGATTSFTAIEVANLMTELGRAGFKPVEINDMTAAVLDLARATGTDATRSAGIMAATLRQFELGATDAAKAADLLTYTANNTFNTVDSLGESLKYAGPVAKSLGMSLEDTLSILGALGNVGIQGSEAGTALRRLSVISAGAGEKIKELFNVSNTDSTGKLKSLVDILDDINTATRDMPVAERTKRMAAAFGLLGITSANVLSRSANGVRGLADGLKTAEGTAAKTAKEMDAGLGGALRIMLSAVEGTALAIGDALAPGLQKIIKFLEAASTAATKFVKANQSLIVNVAKGVAAFVATGLALIVVGTAISFTSGLLGVLLSVSTGVVGGLAAVTATLAGMTIGFASAIVSVASYTAASVAGAAASGAAWAIANIPLLLLIGAVGGLTLAMIQAYDGVGLVTSAVQSIPAAVGSAIKVFQDLAKIGGKTFEGINAAIEANNLENGIKILMVGIKAAFLRGWESVMSVVDGFVNGLESAIGDILGRWEDFSSVFGRVGAFLGNKADQEAIALIDQGLVEFGSKGRLKGQLERERARSGAADARKAATAAAVGELNAAVAGAARPGMTPKAGGRAPSGPLDIAAFDAKQAEDFIAAAAKATGLESLSQITADFNKLVEAGNVSTQQQQRFQSASDTAMRNIDPEIARAFAADEEARKRQQEIAVATKAAAEQSQTAGTFSAAAVSGMGFGGSLQERIAKATERTADAVEQGINDEGAVLA